MPGVELAAPLVLLEEGGEVGREVVGHLAGAPVCTSTPSWNKLHG
jgi:hypothetical protein